MSPEINSSIQTIIIALLALVTTVILPWLGKLVIAWFEAKIAKINDERARAAAQFALERFDHIVKNVVAEISQARPTGEALTKEQAKELLARAYNRIKAQTTDEIMEAVKRAVRDPDRYIVTKIEAAVGRAKDDCK